MPSSREFRTVIVNRITRTASLAIAAAVLTATGPALASKKKDREAAARAAEAINPRLAEFAQGAAVHAYYRRYRGPDWFKDDGAAAARLAAVLRRAQLEGFVQGPILASEVESAALAAKSEDKAARAAAEELLSAILVTYVEAVQRPSADVIFGYPSLARRPTPPEKILAGAAAAPSLVQHLDEVAAVNPLYNRLRDAAWTQLSGNPAAVPDRRVMLNLDRLRSLPRTERFALVNIANQTLTMYENNQPVDSMKVVVGTDELPTPMISSVIYYATFNPYWNVPDHLVRKTVAPGVLKGGVAYLTVRGYQVMSDWSANATPVAPTSIDWAAVASGKIRVRVRQNPGPSNSMGKLKFSFENGEGIFLHDTPTREYFGRPQRALSNGCVRLEDAKRFGRWLLKRDAVPPSAEPEQFVQLPVGVPVYITYLTATESSGKIAFANDIYGWDAGGKFKPLGAAASAAR
jgi:murein L,D-transpeptidase YcbB/YkuD